MTRLCHDGTARHDHQTPAAPAPRTRGPPMTISPTVTAAADRQPLQWLGRTTIDVLVDAAASGGQCTVIDVRTQAGDGAPLHVHSCEEEMFIVVDGAVTFWVGDERHDVTA